MWHVVALLFPVLGAAGAYTLVRYTIPVAEHLADGDLRFHHYVGWALLSVFFAWVFLILAYMGFAALRERPGMPGWARRAVPPILMVEILAPLFFVGYLGVCFVKDLDPFPWFGPGEDGDGEDLEAFDRRLNAAAIRDRDREAQDDEEGDDRGHGVPPVRSGRGDGPQLRRAPGPRQGRLPQHPRTTGLVG